MFRLVTILLLALGGYTASVPETNGLSKRASPPPTDTAFINKVLATVNSIRAKHAAPAMTWDKTLASYALQKSNGCKAAHGVRYNTTFFQKSLSSSHRMHFGN